MDWSEKTQVIDDLARCGKPRQGGAVMIACGPAEQRGPQKLSETDPYTRHVRGEDVHERFTLLKLLTRFATPIRHLMQVYVQRTPRELSAGRNDHSCASSGPGSLRGGVFQQHRSLCITAGGVLRPLVYSIPPPPGR